MFPKSIRAQELNWTSYSERNENYPEKDFFTGFMSQYVGKAEDLDLAKSKLMEQAKIQLSENIKISIESNIVNKMSNVNSQSLEEFEKTSVSYSQISLSGLKTEYAYNPKKKEASAFAWIRKTEVQKFYTDLLASTYAEAEELLQTAQQWSNSNQALSLKTLYKINPLIRSLEESQTILIISGTKDSDLILRKKIQALKRQTADLIQSIEQNKDLSLSQLASIISHSILKQVGPMTMKVENITFKEAGVASEFSERYTQILSATLVVDGFRVSVANADAGSYLLSGTYWEEGEDIHIIQNLYRISEDNSLKVIVASGEGWTTKQLLSDANLDYLPPNYSQAKEQKHYFSTEEIINGGANLELKTNKGDAGIIFKEGEKLSLSLRLNKPGYVRLVNYWADGTMVLLLDNYFVDYAKVNQIIPLPLDLEVACPCGVEFIQVIAQSIAFVPLEVVEREGFSFINEPFEKVVKNNRSQSKGILNSEGFTVESRLTITTLGNEY